MRVFGPASLSWIVRSEKPRTWSWAFFVCGGGGVRTLTLRITIPAPFREDCGYRRNCFQESARRNAKVGHPNGAPQIPPLRSDDNKERVVERERTVAKGETVVESHPERSHFPLTSARRETNAYSLNRIGLERSGSSTPQLKALQARVSHLLAAKLNTSQALERLRGGGELEDSVGTWWPLSSVPTRCHQVGVA